MKHIPGILVGLGIIWAYRFNELFEITVIDPVGVVALAISSVITFALVWSFLCFWGYMKRKYDKNTND